MNGRLTKRDCGDSAERLERRRTRSPPVMIDGWKERRNADAIDRLNAFSGALVAEELVEIARTTEHGVLTDLVHGVALHIVADHIVDSVEHRLTRRVEDGRALSVQRVRVERVVDRLSDRAVTHILLDLFPDVLTGNTVLHVLRETAHLREVGLPGVARLHAVPHLTRVQVRALTALMALALVLAFALALALMLMLALARAGAGAFAREALPRRRVGLSEGAGFTGREDDALLDVELALLSVGEIEVLEIRVNASARATRMALVVVATRPTAVFAFEATAELVLLTALNTALLPLLPLLTLLVLLVLLVLFV